MDTNMDTKRVVVLHGLGEHPTDWRQLTTQLSERGWQPSTPWLFEPGLLQAGWTLDAAVDHVAQTMNGQPAHLVGHSLGGVIALKLAIDHPQLVASLYLCAPQAKPPQAIMAVQSLLFRLLPASMTVPEGLTKPQMLAVLAEVKNLDLMAKLPEIKIPTTLVCGSKDRLNLPAAHAITAAIAQAKLIVVAEASHQLPRQRPDAFLNHLLAQLGS